MVVSHQFQKALLLVSMFLASVLMIFGVREKSSVEINNPKYLEDARVKLCYIILIAAPWLNWFMQAARCIFFEI